MFDALVPKVINTRISLSSSTAELWTAFGDEGGNSLLRAVRAAGRDD
jgi:hypothetical protein